jgi:ankyrin repeat protein
VLRYGKPNCKGPDPFSGYVSVLAGISLVQDHFRLSKNLDELDGQSHSRSCAELVPIYELTAFKFIELPVYRISLYASSILRVDAFLRKAGSNNYAIELCKRFCAAYYAEEIHNPELDFVTKPLVLDGFHESAPRRRNLVRHHVDHALHVATILGDCDAIRVALGTDVDAVNLLSGLGHCFCCGPIHSCTHDSDTRTGFPALYLAIRRKSEAVIELLLNNGADPNVRPQDSFTPLHAAAEWGNEKIVKMLIDRGADIHAFYQTGCYDCGYTALHIAAEQGHQNIVCLLLDNGAKHSVTCRRPGCIQWPPIYFATRWGHENVVRLLLERGATVDPTLEGDRTLLSMAAGYGYEAVVQVLLAHGAKVSGFEEIIRKTLCNAADAENRTSIQTLINAGGLHQAYGLEDPSLFDAAEQGLEDVVKVLLANGEDVDQEGPYRDCCHVTTLFVAALNGHKDIVWLLLDHGANIQKEACHYRYTPIRSAVRTGHSETVQMLLDLGADPYAGPFSALHDACFSGQLEVVKLLLDNGVDVNNRSRSDGDFPGRPPLYSAAYVLPGWRTGPHPAHSIVRLLLDRGADVNTELYGGTTLLHECLTFKPDDNFYGRNEIPESLFYFLLDKGADINAKDSEGRTPLHYIAKLDERVQCDKDIPHYIRHLVSKGAKIYARDHEGRTPIDVAVGPAQKELQRIVRESERTSRKAIPPLPHRAVRGYTSSRPSAVPAYCTAIDRYA